MEPRKITKKEMEKMKVLGDDGTNKYVEIDGKFYNVADDKWIDDDVAGWENV